MGCFSTQALGHPSELSPFTAYWTAQRVHSFAQIFATFIFQDCELDGLAFLRHDHEAAIPFLAAYFELQDALEAATEELTSLEDGIFRRIDESDDEDNSFDSPEA